MSGERFLTALVTGVEVECRIGNSVYPEHYDRGWHIHGGQRASSAPRRLAVRRSGWTPNG